MKSIFFIILITAFAELSAFAQSTKMAEQAGITKKNTIITTTLNVSGNCGMCKRRIEEACVLKGVKAAKWDTKTSVLSLSFDSKQTNLGKIGTAIAKAGYDNDQAKTTDKTYSKLPKCCQYRDENATKH